MCLHRGKSSSVLPNLVWIGHGDIGFWQPVSYDHLPVYCTTCSHLGHETDNCSSDTLPESQPSQQWRPKEIQPNQPSGSDLPQMTKAAISTHIFALQPTVHTGVPIDSEVPLNAIGTSNTQTIDKNPAIISFII